MSTIVGIDFGMKKIGIAVVKLPNGLPYPLSVCAKAQGMGERSILRAIEDHKAELLVVGVPLTEDNKDTSTSLAVRTFCRRIVRRHPIKIFLIDESDSSQEAAERRRAVDKQNSDQDNLDAYAACIILERYLDPSRAYHIGEYQIMDSEQTS